MDQLQSIVDALNSVVTNSANAYGTVSAADALAHPQLGTNGYYTQGQFKQQAAMPSGLLLIGGAVLLLFLFQK